MFLFLQYLIWLMSLAWHCGGSLCLFRRVCCLVGSVWFAVLSVCLSVLFVLFGRWFVRCSIAVVFHVAFGRYSLILIEISYISNVVSLFIIVIIDRIYLIEIRHPSWSYIRKTTLVPIEIILVILTIKIVDHTWLSGILSVISFFFGL